MEQHTSATVKLPQMRREQQAYLLMEMEPCMWQIQISQPKKIYQAESMRLVAEHSMYEMEETDTATFIKTAESARWSHDQTDMENGKKSDWGK